MTDWINVKDRLPNDVGCVLKVKRENGSQVTAYYHQDQMSWLRRYYKGNLSHFQDRESKKFLFDVTHWMLIDE